MRNIYTPERSFSTAPFYKSKLLSEWKAALALVVMLTVIVLFFGVLTVSFVEVV